MMVPLIILGIISLVELGLWLPIIWAFHKYIAVSVLVMLMGASALLLIKYYSGWTLLISFFTLYRLINLLRLAKNRMQADYLYSATRRTGLALIACQLVVSGTWAISRHSKLHNYWWLLVVAVAQIIISAWLLVTTRRNLRATQPPDKLQNLTDAELPSLTVAIPARNETEDLRDCLESLVGSNYPKLEILVLDDCSQNRQTPEIIRSFAHAGVRFIGGAVPPEQWLAKNYAYRQLVETANGSVLLFCGVDTRFEAGSLRAMVQAMVGQKLDMLCWLPRNNSPHGLTGSLLQPNRYAWELSLPRHWLKRPPVLSTCWLITAELLHSSGSFKALSRSSSPESYFARQALGRQSYGFFQSSQPIGLNSVKSQSEQRDTAVRTRYLQVHRKPELVALVSLAEAGLLIGAPLLAIAAIVVANWVVAGLASLACILLGIVFAHIVSLTYRQWLWRGLWQFPLAAIYDLMLLNYSQWQYEFGEVIWKGRNICLPVMRTAPIPPATSDSAQRR